MNAHLDTRRFDPEAARQLGRIDLVAKVVVDGVRQGLHKSRTRGFSTEFSDFKPYVHGDDMRLLDWRLYARTDRLFVKCFEAETSVEVMLLLDASASMAWRWRDCITKLEYAANLLAALACMYMRQQDQVGLLVHDARTLWHLPPRRRRSHLEAVFGLLETVQPGSADTFHLLVRGLAEAKRHRGIVIACSDLEEDGAGLAEAIEVLAATGNDIILFHLLDRAERELPFDLATHLRDSETQAVMPVNLGRFRDEYRAGVNHFMETWSERCAQNGITHVPIDTSVSYIDAVLAMLRSPLRARPSGTR